MRAYFRLQISMTNRRFKDAGLEPILAYLILATAFITLSIYLFRKTEYFEYFFLFISLTLTTKLSETRRNEFIKISFRNSDFKKIRIIENLAVATPFFLFLLYKQLFISALILVILTILLASANFRTTLNITVPTPFYRKPFEFTVGFRSTFYLFPIAYILACISVSVNNFNLGIFSMLFLFAITLTYYSKPENEHFVWTYKLTAQQFLFEKIKIALLYSSLLITPIVLILGIGFYQNIDYLLLFLLAGYAFLICMILAKYTAYPNEIGLAQGILIAVSLYFPPILILIIPYFFGQSVSKLKILLR